MPVAAAVERLLLDSANGSLTDTCISTLPEVLRLYTKDIDIGRISIQLQMLPDLLKTYNECNPRINNVTNIRTLCEIASQ